MKMTRMSAGQLRSQAASDDEMRSGKYYGALTQTLMADSIIFCGLWLLPGLPKKHCDSI